MNNEPNDSYQKELDLLVATNLNLWPLRRANFNRQIEWPGADAVDLAFRGLELAGEVGALGEVIVDLAALSNASGRLSNALKKRVRLDRGIAGTKESQGDLMEQIADEMGDILISLDLIAMDLGIDLTQATIRKFNRTSAKHNMQTKLE